MLNPFLAMPEVVGARAWQEKGLAQVTAEANLITDGHAHYTRRKHVWPARLRI